MGNVWMEARELKDRQVRFVDARYSLQDRSAGRVMYEAGHISNAVFFDLERDLSDMSSEKGRHPLPSKEQLKTLFETNGFKISDCIAIYDQGGMPFAPRAYWIFKYAGFPDVHLVREGYEQLASMGFEVTKGIPDFPTSSLSLVWDDSILADRAYVWKVSQKQVAGVLLDARSAERYAGLQEPIDSIAGHIPSARNFDWELLKGQSGFRRSEEIQGEIEKIVGKKEEITVYCGSGVTAAPLYAMLKDAGYENVKLYVGSYSDWILEHGVERK